MSIFTAKKRSADPCPKCGLFVEVGQAISWNRRDHNPKVYHVNCSDPFSVPTGSKIKTCKVCGVSGLQWARKDGRWQLHVANADGTASSEVHVHRKLLVKGVAVETTAPSAVIPYVISVPTVEEMYKELTTPQIVEKADSLVKSLKTLDTLVELPKVEKMESLKILKPLATWAEWYEVLDRICQALKEGKIDSTRVLLIGPPGTGKSTTAEILSDAIARIPVHQGMGVEELIGQYHLENGSTIWKDDIVTQAMKQGKTIVIDEIDRFSDEIGSIMYGVTDDRPYVKLGAGQIVKAERGFSVIATMNPGVSCLPEAILDRFECILTATVPHPKANVFDDNSRTNAVSNYFRNLPKDTWKWTGKPTIRRMKAFTKYEPIVGREHAMRLAFGDGAREVESVLTNTKKGGYNYV